MRTLFLACRRSPSCCVLTWWSETEGALVPSCFCAMLCSVTQSCPTLQSMGILQARILEWVAMPCLSLRDLPNPDIKPKSLTLQAYSLLSEPPGKPMNTGVGSHALLQGIFPIQGSNPGLPHCRRILYQLSHQGSPGGLRQQTFKAHSSRGWEVWDQGDSRVSGENPPSGLHPSSSCVSSLVEGKKGSSDLLVLQAH